MGDLIHTKQIRVSFWGSQSVVSRKLLVLSVFGFCYHAVCWTPGFLNLCDRYFETECGSVVSCLQRAETDCESQNVVPATSYIYAVVSVCG